MLWPPHFPNAPCNLREIKTVKWGFLLRRWIPDSCSPFITIQKVQIFNLGATLKWRPYFLGEGVFQKQTRVIISCVSETGSERGSKIEKFGRRHLSMAPISLAEQYNLNPFLFLDILSVNENSYKKVIQIPSLLCFFLLYFVTRMISLSLPLCRSDSDYKFQIPPRSLFGRLIGRRGAAKAAIIEPPPLHCYYKPA